MSSSTTVTVYSGTSDSATKVQELAVGNYDGVTTTFLGGLSRIEVPPLLLADVFQQTSFQGASLTIQPGTWVFVPGHSNYIEGSSGFNDRVLSMKVYLADPGKVTLYSGTSNSATQTQQIELGDYDGVTKTFLGGLSRIEVPTGLVAVVYRQTNYEGESLTISAGTWVFVPGHSNYIAGSSSFNDHVYSIKVQRA